MSAARFLITFAVLGLAACVNLPRKEGNTDSYNDAVGAVTISSPLFVPWEANQDPKRRLDFQGQLDEDTILASLNKRQARSSRLRHTALQLLASAKQQIDPLPEGESAPGTTANPTEGRDKPKLAAEGINEKLVELLSPVIQEDYALAPDDAATLTAAYKTLMVNLEEYYNLGSLGGTDPVSSELLPYKVHFTVSAEPGWYSRYHNFDAVAQVTFPEGYRVISVSPPETAQAVEQLDASLDQFLLSLEASGTLGTVTGGAALDRIDQVARRIEGLRANRTLVVGFPEDNQVRIRFRAAVSPVERGLDVQPVSRLLTATVLIPRAIAGSKSSPPAEHTQKSLFAFNGPGAASELKLGPLEIKVKAESWFSGAMRDDAGDRSAPKQYYLWESKDRERIRSDEGYASAIHDVTVPPWLASLNRPLALGKNHASATYHVDPTLLVAPRDEVLKSEKKLKSLSQARAEADTKHVKLKEIVDRLQVSKDSMDALLKRLEALQATPEKDRPEDYKTRTFALRDEIAQSAAAAAQLPSAEDKEKALAELLNKAKQEENTEKVKLDGLRTLLLNAVQQALGSATVYVDIDMEMPGQRAVRDANGDLIVENRRLWLQLVEAPSVAWREAESGTQRRTLTFSPVPLTMAPAIAIEDPAAWPFFTLHLEGALTTSSEAPGGTGQNTERTSIVIEARPAITLRPIPK